jgi:LysR family hydrogen peroxide-inducible transcriptional activator
MTLTELKYIVAVARERHFGKAADACHVSQPTLSVAIKKLEEELDVKLFERSANEVSATPLGEEIIRHAQLVLEQAAEIKEIAKRGKDPLVGALRLGVIYTIGPYLLPDLMRQIMKKAPQMPLMLQENFTVKLMEMLRAGEIDCAILAEPFPDVGLATAALYDEPFMAALPVKHLLAQKKSITAEQLKTKPCCCWAMAIASETMCSKSVLSLQDFLATQKAFAKALKALLWKPSSTWWRPAWA